MWPCSERHIQFDTSSAALKLPFCTVIFVLIAQLRRKAITNKRFPRTGPNQARTISQWWTLCSAGRRSASQISMAELRAAHLSQPRRPRDLGAWRYRLPQGWGSDFECAFWCRGNGRAGFVDVPYLGKYLSNKWDWCGGDAGSGSCVDVKEYAVGLLAFAGQWQPKRCLFLSPSEGLDTVLLDCDGDKLCLGERTPKNWWRLTKPVCNESPFCVQPAGWGNGALRGAGTRSDKRPAARHPEEQSGFPAVLQWLQHPDHNSVLFRGHDPISRYPALNSCAIQEIFSFKAFQPLCAPPPAVRSCIPAAVTGFTVSFREGVNIAIAKFLPAWNAVWIL